MEKCPLFGNTWMYHSKNGIKILCHTIVFSLYKLYPCKNIMFPLHTRVWCCVERKHHISSHLYSTNFILSHIWYIYSTCVKLQSLEYKDTIFPLYTGVWCCKEWKHHIYSHLYYPTNFNLSHIWYIFLTCVKLQLTEHKMHFLPMSTLLSFLYLWLSGVRTKKKKKSSLLKYAHYLYFSMQYARKWQTT